MEANFLQEVARSLQEKYLKQQPRGQNIKKRHQCSISTCDNDSVAVYSDCAMKLCESCEGEHAGFTAKKHFLNKAHRIALDPNNVEYLKELETTYIDMANRWLEKVQERIASVEKDTSDYVKFRTEIEVALRKTIEDTIKDLQNLLEIPNILIMQALCPEIETYLDKYIQDHQTLLGYRNRGDVMAKNIEDLAQILEPMANEMHGNFLDHEDLINYQSMIEKSHEFFENKLENCPILNEVELVDTRAASAAGKKGLEKYKDKGFWEEKILIYIIQNSADLEYREEAAAPPVQPDLNQDLRFKAVKFIKANRTKWNGLNALAESQPVGTDDSRAFNIYQSISRLIGEIHKKKEEVIEMEPLDRDPVQEEARLSEDQIQEAFASLAEATSEDISQIFIERPADQPAEADPDLAEQIRTASKTKIKDILTSGFVRHYAQLTNAAPVAAH